MQSLVENNRFEIKNETEDQAQSILKSIGTLTVLGCIFIPNLEILDSIGGDLWYGQTHKLKMEFYFEVTFDLEGQGQSPPKTIGILTKAFYTYGPNLMILTSLNGWWVIVRTNSVTDGALDGGNDNTLRPKLASGNKIK